MFQTNHDYQARKLFKTHLGDVASALRVDTNFSGVFRRSEVQDFAANIEFI